MINKIQDYRRKALSKLYSFLVATIGKSLLTLLLKTCEFKVKGEKEFCQSAKSHRCILMLWHNRLSITAFILDRYAKAFQYVALVSNSRDGELISSLVSSYKNGKVIKVPHHARSEALRTTIRTIEKCDSIVVITPDGPRGPKYEMKPGIALVAIRTGAHVVALSWEADKYWELNTWDGLRIPKPFAKIQVNFGETMTFNKIDSIETIQEKLKNSLCD